MTGEQLIPAADLREHLSAAHDVTTSSRLLNDLLALHRNAHATMPSPTVTVDRDALATIMNIVGKNVADLLYEAYEAHAYEQLCRDLDGAE